jgi:putative endonuclease
VALFWIYITASRRRTLYTGMTNDLQRRMFEHRASLVKGFSKRYNANRLVYFEAAEEALVAIAREKQIKAWTRKKKVELIERQNPGWRDLSADWFGGA